MTAFDRIERRLPELLEELAPVSLPDYFDDMLHATAQSRQRPAWSSLERWLPMGVIARPLPIRPIPWRLIAIVMALGLLAASALVYVGTQRRVPPPFGPAANGALVIGSADGDIVTIDPATGATSLIIGGPTFDGGPYFSFDGQRLAFDRKPTASSSIEEATLFIAKADGSDVHSFLPASSIQSFDWAPSGDEAIVTRAAGGKGTLSIVNVDDGSSNDLAKDLDVAMAMSVPGTDRLLVTAGPPDARTFWLVNRDGTKRVQLQTYRDANSEPTMSPDGTRFAYTSWSADAKGVINIHDLATDTPRRLTTFDDAFIWLNPQFSPDGKWLVAERFLADSDPPGAQLAILRVDGDGSSTAMGPLTGNPPPAVTYSPDGTKIVATYSDGTTWMFDADGGNAQRQSWSAPAGISWQRKAR